MLRLFYKFKDGFTMVEMLVSISILVILSLVFTANFRAGERKFKLNAVADVLVSNLRNSQQMVLDGAKVGTKEMPLGGYGIHFFSDKYIFFADDNLNMVYDLGEGLATTTLPKDISLEYSSNNLIFAPPKAKICLNNNGCAPCSCSFKSNKFFIATSTLNVTGDKKVIKVNQISGRVETE